jgi:hypothetical protein
MYKDIWQTTFVLAEAVTFIWNSDAVKSFLEMTASYPPPPMLCFGLHCKRVAHMLSFLLLTVCGTCGPHPGSEHSTDFCMLWRHPSVLCWLSVSEQMWCTVMQKGHQRQKWKRVPHCLCPVTSHRQWSSDQSHSRTRSAPCHLHRPTTNCQRSLAVSTNHANFGYRCFCQEGVCV